MLPGDFDSEELNQTRVEIAADTGDVELNLNPFQQYLVFTMANRDDPDEPDGSLLD